MTQAQVFGAIMCGGTGTRMWPLSRSIDLMRGLLPKQFLDLLGTGRTMIQETASRLYGVADEIVVVTNRQQAEVVKAQLPAAGIVLEPMARNTAACIGLAAVRIQRLDPGAVMVVLPSDHYFGKVPELRQVWARAIETACATDALCLIGIEPAWPHPKLGYIGLGRSVRNGVHSVERFIEKPGAGAAALLADKDHLVLWNSGMFVWKVSAILAAIRQHMPVLFEGLEKIKAVMDTEHEAAVTAQVFEALEDKSIDYGVLEKCAKECLVVRAPDLQWADVGSFDVWAQVLNVSGSHPAVSQAVIVQAAGGNIVYAPNETVVFFGTTEPLIVVRNGGVIMVAPASKAPNIGDVPKALQRIRPDLL